MFFFSSRRRHTIWPRDWSSDVCSSDLNSDRRMRDWYDADIWPPTAQKELNPVVDVEDISMLNMTLDNGVLASYEQCHFTPDYWRNYTVIGDAGRIENMGDGGGHQIHIFESRRRAGARHGRVPRGRLGLRLRPRRLRRCAAAQHRGAESGGADGGALGGEHEPRSSDPRLVRRAV